ncbi:RNA-directed DNA polymerase from mobile element jockey [Trichonephila clavipes]|nr:RNA-directed DNA polymerase from mobile element jockey [Trichonephila clavipes]
MPGTLRGVPIAKTTSVEHYSKNSLEIADSCSRTLHSPLQSQPDQMFDRPPSTGLVYDTLDKANLFAETLEETFTENPEPYDDDHIEDVERQVRRFFRTTSFQPLPLERCLVNGYFPPAWKHAIITLLPKPGKDAKFATNYRPISLLSTIGKIIEKIILKRLPRTYGQPQPYPRLPTRVQKRNVYKPPTPPSDQSGYQRVQQWRYYRGCLPRRRESLRQGVERWTNIQDDQIKLPVIHHSFDKQLSE